MDRYEMLNVLGAGNVGVAILVQRRRDGAHFVVKRNDHVVEERADAMRTLSAMAALRHAHLVPVEELFEEPPCIFIVRQYCNGQSLRAQLLAQRDLPFPTAQAVTWLHPLCLALEYMHAQRVTHRNVKPENVLMNVDGVVKLTDPCIDAMTATSATSVAYTAPEVLAESGEPVWTPLCDLWSVGVVLYEMVNLKLPFRANSVMALGALIRQGRFDPVDASVLLELRDVINALLQVNPLQRPPCSDVIALEFIKRLVRGTRPVSVKQTQATAPVWSILPAERSPAQGVRGAKGSSRPDSAAAKKETQDEQTEPPRDLHGEYVSHHQYDEMRRIDFTLLHYVCMQGDENMAAALIDSGEYDIDTETTEKADIDRVWLCSKSTPLHVATRIGHTGIVTLLLDRGADMDSLDHGGWSALHLGCKWGKSDIVKMLLERGIQTEIVDKYLWTPLHLASQSGHASVVSLLLDAGAHLEAKRKDGWTALHVASALGHVDVVRVLLDRGANATAKNNDHQTVLEVTGLSRDATRDEEVRKLLVRYTKSPPLH